MKYYAIRNIGIIILNHLQARQAARKSGAPMTLVEASTTPLMTSRCARVNAYRPSKGLAGGAALASMLFANENPTGGGLDESRAHARIGQVALPAIGIGFCAQSTADVSATAIFTQSSSFFVERRHERLPSQIIDLIGFNGNCGAISRVEIHISH